VTEFGYSDAEREICRITDVRAARVFARPDQPDVAVRVLAVAGRPVDDIVADVRAVALRALGRVIGRSDVHVVQLEDVDAVPAFAAPAGAPPAADWTELLDERAPGAVATEEPVAAGGADVPGPAAAPSPAPPDSEVLGDAGRRTDRVTLDGVLAVRHGLRYTVEVTLHHEGRARTGSARGTAASSVILRLVTEATLAALAQIRPAAARLAVDATTLSAAGERSIALVTLVLLGTSDEEHLVGSAMVRDLGVHDAVARAALDATNRRLQLQG
jgi:hypothetical protein